MKKWHFLWTTVYYTCSFLWFNNCFRKYYRFLEVK